MYKTIYCTYVASCFSVSKQDGTRSEEHKDAGQVESYVAQRYIENPYLINGKSPKLQCIVCALGVIFLLFAFLFLPTGRKFDLRVYVLVTSVCTTIFSNKTTITVVLTKRNQPECVKISFCVSVYSIKSLALSGWLCPLLKYSLFP